MVDFTLWLEFEAVAFATNTMLTNDEIAKDITWDRQNNFCNITVTLPDGRHYGLNVWTYEFLTSAIRHDEQNGDNLAGLYQIPPDLFVRELTRECIETIIADLLSRGDLEQILTPSVIAR